VKRGGSLSFLTIFTFAVAELLSLPNKVWEKLSYDIDERTDGETSMPPYNFVAGGIINWKTWGLTAV
jgi:hypothetical protein